MREIVLWIVTLSVLVGGCARQPRPAPRAKDASTPRPPGRPAAFIAPGASLEADRALLGTLRGTRVPELVLDDVRAVDALGVAVRAAQTGMHLTPRAQAHLEGSAARVSLHVQDVAVDDVLALVTHDVGLRWGVREGRVWVDVPPPAGEPFVVLRFYDTQDFVQKPPRFSSEPLPPVRSETEVTTVLPCSRLLEESIRALIDPEEWTREDRHLECRDGTLVVRALETTHGKIERYLHTLYMRLAPSIGPK